MEVFCHLQQHHMQKENYSTNTRLHYAKNEDQHSNYIKPEKKVDKTI